MKQVTPATLASMAPPMQKQLLGEFLASNKDVVVAAFGVFGRVLF